MIKKVFIQRSKSFLAACFCLWAIGLNACQSGSLKAETDENPPEWINAPSLNEGFYQAVGYSNGRQTATEARKEAVDDAKSNLAQIMESHVSSNVKLFYESVEGGKDSYSEKGVLKEINVKSNVRLNKVEIAKSRFRKNKQGAYHYYVLVRISKKRFDKEMKRLESGYFEKVAAVESKLKKGRQLLSEGLVGDGLEALFEAAINSIRVPNGQSRFDSILSLIQKTLKNIRFEKINDRQKGTLKKGLPEPARVKVSFRHKDKWIAVRKTSFRFFIRKNPGSKYNKTGQSDDHGMVSCRVSRFSRGGKEVKLVVRLDLDRSLDLFDVLVNRKWRSRKASLEEWVDDCRSIFRFSVSSPFREEKSAVILIVRSPQLKLSKNSLLERDVIMALKRKRVFRISIVDIPPANRKTNKKILDHCAGLDMKKIYVLEMRLSRKPLKGKDLITCRGRIHLLDIESGDSYAEASSQSSVSIASNSDSSPSQRAIKRLLSRVAGKLVRNLFNRL
ncbi:MAG: hypothetical protein OEZ36_12830 [Spirochaetota bacterium]|nr:hypothetical protein [Spirochaetota bacterium]